MIASIIAYFVAILLAYIGLYGLYQITKSDNSEAAYRLFLSLLFFAGAYGCARLAGI